MKLGRASIGFAFVLCACGGEGRAKTVRPALAAPPGAFVAPLDGPRRAVHAYGRKNDLTLGWPNGGVFTFAADRDLPGHRPLRGALLDVGSQPGDRPDPLLWMRAATIDRAGAAHQLVASEIDPAGSSGGCSPGAGVRAGGVVEGVRLQTVWCAEDVDGVRRVRAKASAESLPEGTTLAWELNPGTADPIVNGRTADWEGEAETSYVVIAEHGVALLVESSMKMVAARRLVHIASEAFPAPLVLKPPRDATLSLRVFEGDAIDALSGVSGTRVPVTVTAESGSFVRLLGDNGELVAEGRIDPSGKRRFEVPDKGARSIEVRSPRGVFAMNRPLGVEPLVLEAPRAKEGKVELRYVDGSGPTPARVLFGGLDGTPDPEPRVSNSDADPQHAAFADRRSAFLAHGAATVGLPPGRYRIVATAGPTHTLAIREVEVRDGEVTRVDGELREIVDTKDWVSADFHLHAAPSPDSRVSLDARVASLAASHVDLGVATDHNRITDYGPSTKRLELEDRVVTVVGDEITSAGPHLLGHFNAFPFPVPTGAPEDSVPPYYLVPAADMFVAARQAGARVVQVNHARMPPSIGYFDLTGFDAKTGVAKPELAFGFDALEAHNGLWLEQESRVREGVHDLVGLARRSVLVAATGNSDSHKLHWETAGWPRTYVHTAREPRATRADRTLEALLARKTTVSAGPFVEATVEGADPGAIVHLTRKKARVHVRVSAPSWIPVDHVEIWKDDAIAIRLDVPGPAKDGVRFERDIEVDVSDDAVLLVWADADNALPDGLPLGRSRPIGFTSLFYVDADGDGAVKVPAGR